MAREGAARVFLSYARADRVAVEPIAAALTAAGHQVWWDTQLEGGHSFSAEIERELAAADAVVVGWSATSARSNWVLDEAGAGRDRGRLVPLALDATPPPLGFRQYQAIDFAGWDGRADGPPAQALARAVARVAAGDAPARAPAAAAQLAGAKPPPPMPKWVVAIVIISVLFGLAVAWRAVTGRMGPAKPPVAAAAAPQTIAVLPFANLRAGATDAYFAEGLAEEILDALARDAKLKVIGRTTAWALREQAGDLKLMREKLGVTRLLEGSVRGGAGRVKVSVRLIDTADGQELWSQAFDRRGTDTLAIQEEIARAVARRLGGAPIASTARPPSAPGVYEKYIVAKQLIRTRQVAELIRARALLQDAIRADDGYAPAHAALSAATALLSEGFYGTMPSADSQAAALREGERAVALDAGLAEAHAALGRARSDGGDLAAGAAVLARAVELDPANAEARAWLGRDLVGLGQYRLADFHQAEAVAVDPLWIVPVGNLIDGHGRSERPELAGAVAARFRALSPDPAATDYVDSKAAQAIGEFARALALADRSIARNPRSTLARRARVASLRSLMAGDRLSATEVVRGGAAGRAMATGRWSDAADALLARGPLAWNEYADSLAFALDRTRRRGDLLRSFAARYPAIVDFTQAPQSSPFVAVTVARALAEAGRAGDARALTTFARARLVERERSGLARSETAITWAGLLVAEGDRAGAIARLEAGVAARWSDVCAGPIWLGEQPMLAPLRGDPRFEALLARCRDRLNAERRRAGMGPATLP